MKWSSLIIGLSVLMLFLGVGCATVLNTPTTSVKVQSHPEQATVLLNGRDVGTTPLTLTLDRNSPHNLAFLIRGYEIQNVQIEPKLDYLRAIGGNLVSWNIIGVFVDIRNGSAYLLRPGDVQVELTKVQSLYSVRIAEGRDSLRVVLTDTEQTVYVRHVD